MILMDGRKLKNKKIAEYKKRVAKLKTQPHIVMIQIGDNLGSKIYLKHKQKTCAEIGIKSTRIKLASNTSFFELKTKIMTLNNDEQVDGILVQFPLPSHMSRREVAMLIDPEKDVDGMHPLNEGMIVTNTINNRPRPCTPSGVMQLLQEYNLGVANKYVVVIGRSNIAGRPLANMLINANATVTQMHSQTPVALRKQLLKDADIIVTATGQKDLFEPSDVKNGVIIIDIGIIRENKKLRGDINYREFIKKASYITPVPGGVGPMTVAMLMENIIRIKEKKAKL